MILINNCERRPCCHALPGFPFSHRSLRRSRNADRRLCLKKRAHRAERFRPYPRLYPMGEGPALGSGQPPKENAAKRGQRTEACCGRKPRPEHGSPPARPHCPLRACRPEMVPPLPWHGSGRAHGLGNRHPQGSACRCCGRSVPAPHAHGARAVHARERSAAAQPILPAPGTVPSDREGGQPSSPIALAGHPSLVATREL